MYEFNQLRADEVFSSVYRLDWLEGMYKLANDPMQSRKWTQACKWALSEPARKWSQARKWTQGKETRKVRNREQTYK